MSGLAGILNLDGAPVDTALLARMTQHMAFRGPDAQATWAEGAAGLGHTLLRTTFEAAKERQPLSLDGAVWMAADARVDGRAELLPALRAAGQAVAADAPDGELILHAYHAWGEAGLERLIGDFAFAIWDAPRRRLLLAHDQFGVAPLYYAQVGQSLLFSNTLNALRLHPGVPDDLDEQAIADFLLFGMNLDPATTSFAGIRRLPPAHKLTWEGGEVRVARYWSPPPSRIVYREPQETVAEFSALFEQAVADRLRTERVATQLSGGMDSASVALVACRLRDRTGVPAEVRAHTHVYKKLFQDEEGRYAQLVAEHARLPVEYITADDDGQPVEEANPLSPEPGAMPVRAASRQMRAGIEQFSRVLLTGFGGDPLLYPSQTYLVDLARTFHWGRLLQSVRLAWQMQGDLPPLYVRTLLKRWLGRQQPPSPLPRWVRPELVERLGLAERWADYYRPRQDDARLGMAHKVFWSNLFAKSDAGFTQSPVQVRYPFFDVRLLSFVQSVPPLPWLNNKLLLREVMRDIMPESVRQRPKTPLGGFPMQASAQQHGLKPRILELAGAAELEPYVERRNLMLSMQHPDRLSGLDYSQIIQPLALAYWLQRRRRPD